MTVVMGIVGLGRWGRRLVDAVQTDGRPSGASLRFSRAVIRHPDADASAYASAQGLAVERDLTGLLSADDVQAVVVATPPSLHAEHVVQAAAAGKHVLVEKPLALDPADAARAAAACAEAGVVLAVAQQFRFLPAYLRLRSLLDAEALGSLIHLEGNVSSGAAHHLAAGHWRATIAENPAGPLTTYGEHVLDLMLDLAGGIRAVTARIRRVAVEPGSAPDVADLALELETGTTGQLASISSCHPYFRLAVFGTDGWAEILPRTRLTVGRPGEPLAVEELGHGEPERASLDAFGRAVAGGPAYPVTPAGAVHIVAAIAAAAESAAGGGGSVPVDPVGSAAPK